MQTPISKPIVNGKELTLGNPFYQMTFFQARIEMMLHKHSFSFIDRKNNRYTIFPKYGNIHLASDVSLATFKKTLELYGEDFDWLDDYPKEYEKEQGKPDFKPSFFYKLRIAIRFAWGIIKAK